MVIPWDFRVAYFQTNTLGLEAENDGKKPFHWVIINFLINIAAIWGIASLTLEKHALIQVQCHTLYAMFQYIHIISHRQSDIDPMMQD